MSTAAGWRSDDEFRVTEFRVQGSEIREGTPGPSSLFDQASAVTEFKVQSSERAGDDESSRFRVQRGRAWTVDLSRRERGATPVSRPGSRGSRARCGAVRGSERSEPTSERGGVAPRRARKRGSRARVGRAGMGPERSELTSERRGVAPRRARSRSSRARVGLAGRGPSASELTSERGGVAPRRARNRSSRAREGPGPGVRAKRA